MKITIDANSGVSAKVEAAELKAGKLGKPELLAVVPHGERRDFVAQPPKVLLISEIDPQKTKED